MMSLAECKKIITEKEITDDHFLRQHFCVEAIIKRLFLIGLRLQGVQYRIAQTIAEEYPAMGLKNHLIKVFDLCGVDYTQLKTIGKYNQLEELFLVSPHAGATGGFTEHHRK
jgi:uncharacterized protein with HEPN domain